MAKIVMIGAGSMGFTRKLIIDILNFKALRDSTIALVDIDAGRLDNPPSRIIDLTGKKPAIIRS